MGLGGIVEEYALPAAQHGLDLVFDVNRIPRSQFKILARTPPPLPKG